MSGITSLIEEVSDGGSKTTKESIHCNGSLVTSVSSVGKAQIGTPSTPNMPLREIDILPPTPPVWTMKMAEIVASQAVEDGCDSDEQLGLSLDVEVEIPK